MKNQKVTAVTAYQNGRDEVKVLLEIPLGFKFNKAGSVNRSYVQLKKDGFYRIDKNRFNETTREKKDENPDLGELVAGNYNGIPYYPNILK